MRTFHITWLSFFICFIAWFAVAPLMPLIRDELHLTKQQIGNIMIASMAMTVFVRLLIGFICDHLGPRVTYTGLLILGSLPVFGIALANSYESFLFFRLLIGGIGASFVLTQTHTSRMFAPNIVGTANATTAGWGNLGGGVAQILMPLIVSIFLGLGLTSSMSWRVSMLFPGFAMLVCALLYWKFTQDTPEGNLSDLKKKNPSFHSSAHHGSIKEVLADRRVWALFILYGACFGIELTVYSSASLYFTDKFQLGLKAAGIVAGIHGLLNIFGRTLGGAFADKLATRFGMQSRVQLLMLLILLEGAGLTLFSRMNHLWLAVGLMLIFSLFVQMACGATYAIVPFINKKRLGLVSGIIGAGGNMGAIAAGFLFRSDALSMESGFAILGIAVFCSAILTVLVRFAPVSEVEETLSGQKIFQPRPAAQ